MTDSLNVHLLGLPRILYGNSHTPDFPTEKVKLLFCFLVLFRKTAHARSMLSGLFWGDSPEPRARHSFNTAVWRLRQWVGGFQGVSTPIIVIDDDRIGLNPHALCWLDTGEFEEHISLAQRLHRTAPEIATNSLHRAVELYQGQLMEGCYADWCLIERDRLHQLFMQALIHLMVFHTTQREYLQAINCAQRILRDDPLREEVQRELIKLFILNQQPDDALSQYRRCETILEQELGIKPMRETSELFQKMIRGTESIRMQLNHTPIPGQHPSSSQLKSLVPRMHALLHQFDDAREELAQTLEFVTKLCESGSQSDTRADS